MSEVSPPEFDYVLHQPVRTRIVAYLAGRQEASFSELKRVLQLSDGNLKSHLEKLLAAEYVIARHEDGPGRPQSLYGLSSAGRNALKTYVNSLKAILPSEEEEARFSSFGAVVPKPSS
ncbi:transcriptional regulator [Pelagibacterium halotolerans]|uniref:transcriptional regulator n=1 Tax=Pelagibacterium halotolerans TaxID=531813 RepID=UPI00384F51E5